MRIREARESDAEAAAGLWTEAYTARGAGEGRALPYAADDFFDSARRGEPFLAERGGELVGIVVFYAPGAAGTAIAAPGEAELSRLTNVALKKQLKWSEYEAFARLGAMSRMTEQRRPDKDEPRIPVPGWMADMALGEGARVAATLTEAGVNVIGDLENLTKPIPAHRLSETAVALPSEVPVQAAVEAVAGAVLAGREDRRRLRQKLKATRQALGEGRVDQLTSRQLASILWQRLALATKRRIFRR